MQEQSPDKAKPCRDLLTVFRLFVIVLEQIFAYPIHITRSDGEYNISGSCGFAKAVFYLTEGLEELCAVYHVRQILGAYTESIFFTGSENLRKIDDIRPL